MSKFDLKRLQLFEFTDLKWWPNFFRSMTTSFLQAMIEKNHPYSEKLDLITNAIESTPSDNIIDLCSGNFGPWFHLKKQIEENSNNKINVIFTDKYPNNKLAKTLDNMSGFDYYPDSVDAKDIPKNLVGVRTIFNGLHHFNQEDAQKIINNSVENKQPIIIFEILERSWFSLLMSIFFIPFYVLIQFPFLMKLSFLNVFFTYIIPIFPIVFTWDTMVSNLRSYSEEELERMIQGADKNDNYKWHIGSYQHRRIPVLYLIAYPV